MILTDFYHLIGTDPTNRYQELKKFAQKIGLRGEDIGNINGILYFPIWTREYTQKALKAGVYFVHRKKITEFIETGKITQEPTLYTNFGWYAHNHFAERTLREIAEHFGWTIPKFGVRTKKFHFEWTRAWHEDPEFNTFNIKFDRFNPEGVCWIDEDGTTTLIDIPQHITDKIIAFARPIPHYFAHKRRKR